MAWCDGMQPQRVVCRRPHKLLKTCNMFSTKSCPARSPINAGTYTAGGTISGWSLPCMQVAPALCPRLCTTSTQLCTRRGRQRAPVPLQRASTCAICRLGMVGAPGSLLRLVGQSCRPLTAAGTACTVLNQWGCDTSASLTCPACLVNTVALNNSHLSFGQRVWQLSLMLPRVAAFPPRLHFSSLDAQHVNKQAEVLSLVPASMRGAHIAPGTAAAWLVSWHRSCQRGVVGPVLLFALVPAALTRAEPALTLATILNACSRGRLR